MIDVARTAPQLLEHCSDTDDMLPVGRPGRTAALLDVSFVRRVDAPRSLEDLATFTRAQNLPPLPPPGTYTFRGRTHERTRSPEACCTWVRLRCDATSATRPVPTVAELRQLVGETIRDYGFTEAIRRHALRTTVDERARSIGSIYNGNSPASYMLSQGDEFADFYLGTGEHSASHVARRYDDRMHREYVLFAEDGLAQLTYALVDKRAQSIYYRAEAMQSNDHTVQAVHAVRVADDVFRYRFRYQSALAEKALELAGTANLPEWSFQNVPGLRDARHLSRTLVPAVHAMLAQAS